jgi:hypothetical protein
MIADLQPKFEPGTYRVGNRSTNDLTATFMKFLVVQHLPCPVPRAPLLIPLRALTRNVGCQGVRLFLWCALNMQPVWMNNIVVSPRLSVWQRRDSVSCRLQVTDSICPMLSSKHASGIQVDCSITHTTTTTTNTNYFISPVIIVFILTQLFSYYVGTDCKNPN